MPELNPGSCRMFQVTLSSKRQRHIGYEWTHGDNEIRPELCRQAPVRHSHCASQELSDASSSSTEQSTSSIASLEEKVTTTNRTKPNPIVDALSELSEGMHVLTNPAKDVVMIGHKDMCCVSHFVDKAAIKLPN
jgi:hypothetical protein